MAYRYRPIPAHFQTCLSSIMLPIFEGVDGGEQRMDDGLVAEIETNEDRRHDRTESSHDHQMILVHAVQDHPVGRQPLHATTDLHQRKRHNASTYKVFRPSSSLLGSLQPVSKIFWGGQPLGTSYPRRKLRLRVHPPMQRNSKILASGYTPTDNQYTILYQSASQSTLIQWVTLTFAKT